MKKDFDNEFGFLDELEAAEHTKEKKTEKQIEKKKSAEPEKRVEKKKPVESEKQIEKKKPVEPEKQVEKKKPAEPEKRVEKKRPAEAEKRMEKKKQPVKKRRKKDNPLIAFWKSLAESASEMSMGDRIVASTGVMVLVLAIITGSVYLSARGVDEQIAAFAEIGEDLETVSLSGESGLLAVTDAEVAARNAEIEEIAEETESMEETEEAEAVEDEVLLNLTSVQKDLKIKFMNRATGKLISGIAFQASVKAPGGKSVVYTDDDKDGIIYKTDLTPGSYEVSLAEIDALKGYRYSTAPISVKVKDKIEYKQIDVTDEIKTEAQVNAAAEDTSVKEKEAEKAPALTDTVEWVESTKTAVGSDGASGEYKEVDKDDIPDPMELASLGSRFRALTQEGGLFENGAASGEETGKETEKEDNKKEEEKQEENKTENNNTENNNPETDKKEENADNPQNGSQTPKVSGVSISGASDLKVGVALSLSAKVEGENLSDEDKKVSWSSSDKAVASVSESGTVTGIAAGKVTITAVSKRDESKKASCTIEVKQDAVTVSLDKQELSLKIGDSASLTAKTSRGGVKWISGDEKIAKVSEDGKVTAAAEGSTTISAVSKEDGGVSASCKVTVTKAGALSVKVDPSELKLFTKKDKEIKASVSDASGEVSYQFEVKDSSIAELDADKATCEVEGIKAGETEITVTVKDASGAKASASCKVKVILNPKEDKSSKLKDEDGNQLYVQKDGKYTEAVYADYYTEDEFYKKADNVTYQYTGWQTINGRTYFYDKNGKPVTGEQIIQGAKYVFGSDGALAANSSSGIMGIDVSKWNGTINWTNVKNSGVNYVIIRCGYRGSSTGALIQDPKFKANIQGAEAAGIKVGIYFFSQAVNEVEAVEEASMTLNMIKGHKISYPVFIDVESSGGRADKIDKNTRTAVVNAFCRTIQNGGYTAGIYANKTWFESKMNTASLSGYKIWLAQYAAAPTYQATRYDMWQYTSKGKINGISGNVDMNISYLGY